MIDEHAARINQSTAGSDHGQVSLGFGAAMRDRAEQLWVYATQAG
jgi:hypothetical protein